VKLFPYYPSSYFETSSLQAAVQLKKVKTHFRQWYPSWTPKSEDEKWVSPFLVSCHLVKSATPRSQFITLACYRYAFEGRKRLCNVAKHRDIPVFWGSATKASTDTIQSAMP